MGASPLTRSVPVVRVDHPATRRGGRRVARAIVADADDEDHRSHGFEAVTFLEVLLQLVHELFLDVHHAAANLAHRMVMLTARELVVRRAIA
jgi:hypothetical protein